MSNLVVAEDERWLDVFGVVPQTEESTGDDFVREVVVRLNADDRLHVTWDVTDSSLRLRHQRGGASALDFYREAVTQISVDRRSGADWILVEYGELEFVGRLTVRIDDRVSIEDQLLRG